MSGEYDPERDRRISNGLGGPAGSGSGGGSTGFSEGTVAFIILVLVFIWMMSPK